MSPKKRVLLGVTGGIAAYKSPDLVRRLITRGAEVQVVMSSGAQSFVTPLTFQAVSGHPVRSELWDTAAEAAMGHIELARWAEIILIAPATADFIARLAQGRADDLLTTLCLATEAPILVCDEPTANLDGEARASFFEQLAERPKNDVVVLCSHRIEEVRQIVRRVVELGDGRIVRDAPLEDLLRDLRAFRVEIALRDGARAAGELLRARGFEPCGLQRFAANLSQHEKVQRVTQALADIGDEIADLSVTPVDDLATASRACPPRLKVVA